MTARLYLTRSEIFAAAWALFRSARGAKATRAQHPNYFDACLRNAWASAKGDAYWLISIRDARRELSRPAAWTRRPASTGRRFASRTDLQRARDWAA